MADQWSGFDQRVGVGAEACDAEHGRGTGRRGEEAAS
jgi:hypothetical protein